AGLPGRTLAVVAAAGATAATAVGATLPSRPVRGTAHRREVALGGVALAARPFAAVPGGPSAACPGRVGAITDDRVDALVLRTGLRLAGLVGTVGRLLA